MSDELRKNYEIFEINHPDYRYLVLRRFCHSIEQQNRAVTGELAAAGYKGWVLFDNLFKGGNTVNRYGRRYFDKEFTGPMLAIEVAADDPIRVMVSRYLQENNFVEGTSLTEKDIRTVMEGGVI